MRSHLPDTRQFINRQIPDYPLYTVIELLGTGNNGHVFRARAAKLARDVACKVIPVSNLVGVERDSPSWLEEVHKANALPSSRVVKFFHVGKWELPDGDCVVLLSDLVNGKTLRDFISNHSIDVGFVVDFFRDMLDFLLELELAQMEHGDLHAGNILVEDRTAALTGPPYRFRVTDFGVTAATSGIAPRDDFGQLATMLSDILRRVDYQQCAAEDRFIYMMLRDDLLAKGLLEQDHAHDPRARNPRLLYESLESVRARFRAREAGVTRQRLVTPFDYLSCEQLGEAHALLKELYSDKMLGLPAIEDANNLILTGPRGCGKTTVFRSLSLKHRIFVNDAASSTARYVAIYYRCDDLYFSFPRYETPAFADALNLPLHFVTATLVQELLESLRAWLTGQPFQQAAREDETAAARALWLILNLPKPQQPSADSFIAIERAMSRERQRAAEKQRFVRDPKQTYGHYFGPDVLPAVCAALQSNLSSLGARPIYFLIDDYSSPKISAQLQRNLNRLFMHRTAACFFKLATESPASYETSDVDGKAYVEGREFRLINLGMDFIGAAAAEKQRFVDDVFDRRFEYTDNYPVRTLQELLGDDPASLTHNEMARRLRDGKAVRLAGRRALSELCSGDLHFVIELVGKMVAAVGGPEALRSKASSPPAIGLDEQYKVIRAEAGGFLHKLRTLPRGDVLVEVVEAFGNVAASYLRYRDSKNEAGSPPHQASRIEPYADPHLSGAAKEIYDDLLRYSVFIEDVRGKSRRGLVVPRLYLRRFLIPFFGLTFSKRDSLELSVEDFRDLLLAPSAFEARKRLRGADDGMPPEAQLRLDLPDVEEP